MSFRDDGAAALEWAAQYLERVGELPVLAQVDPGDIRARLPASPPEQGEPFANVLRDLDEIVLPGVTHWQSPRFFAYFSNRASEPGILAELLAATLNSVAFLWRTGPEFRWSQRGVDRADSLVVNAHKWQFHFCQIQPSSGPAFEDVTRASGHSA